MRASTHSHGLGLPILCTAARHSEDMGNTGRQVPDRRNWKQFHCRRAVRKAFAPGRSKLGKVRQRMRAPRCALGPDRLGPSQLCRDN